MTTITQRRFEEFGQMAHAATRDQYTLWFYGATGRHKRIEVMLPRLVKKGKLRVFRYGRKLVYVVPRRCKGKTESTYRPYIAHGLGCTEGLIRFWISRHDGIIIPEKWFRGYNIVPEWGIAYPSGLLLYEFCTLHNFTKGGVVAGKINRYKKALPEFEEKFGGPAIVVFVADVDRGMVEAYVKRYLPGGEFYFTDYDSFKAVAIGKAFEAPIYFSGADGNTYPLIKK